MPEPKQLTEQEKEKILDYYECGDLSLRQVAKHFKLSDYQVRALVKKHRPHLLSIRPNQLKDLLKFQEDFHNGLSVAEVLKKYNYSENYSRDFKQRCEKLGLIYPNQCNRVTDLTGKQFGNLTVLYWHSHSNTSNFSSSKWAVRCACGQKDIIEGVNLKRGITTRCGNCVDLCRQQSLTALNKRRAALRQSQLNSDSINESTTSFPLTPELREEILTYHEMGLGTQSDTARHFGIPRYIVSRLIDTYRPDLSVIRPHKLRQILQYEQDFKNGLSLHEVLEKHGLHKDYLWKLKRLCEEYNIIYPAENNYIEDLTGQQFGNRTVLYLHDISSNRKNTFTKWAVRCSCGQVDVIRGANLKRGTANECRKCAYKTRSQEYYLEKQHKQYDSPI